MTLNELNQHFIDLNYQTSRMLKSEKIDQDYLNNYCQIATSVEQTILTLSLSPEIDSEITGLHEIDLGFTVKMRIVAKLVNVLSLGSYRKKYQEKKREKYFRTEIQKRKMLYNYVENRLKLS
jgi:hypothetical protein